MKERTRNILIVVAILVTIVASIVVYGMYRVYTFFTNLGLNREVPAEIKEARITTGADFLERTEFFKLDSPGFMKAVTEGSAIEDEKERERVLKASIAKSFYNFADLKFIGNRVVAAGVFGAYELDLQGGLLKQITFEPTTERVKIGPLETQSQDTNVDNLHVTRLSADRIGYFSYSSLAGVRVFNENGQVIWENGRKTLDIGGLVQDREGEYEKSVHVLEAAVGDLDGDGVSEYIVAKQNDGIRAFDQGGRELWAVSDEYPHRKLLILDMNADGKGELVEVGKAVRDGRTGAVIREIKGRGDAVVSVQRKDKGVDINFADIYDGKLLYTSEDGKTLFTADAPLSKIAKPPERREIPGQPELTYTDDSENVAFPKAVVVKLRKQDPPYLAVLAAFIGLPRANLYVLDQQGKLVYHELLPEEAESIEVLPSAEGGEHLLIGGKDSIWRYTAR
jgi:hypothetical protein